MCVCIYIYNRDPPVAMPQSRPSRHQCMPQPGRCLCKAVPTLFSFLCLVPGFGSYGL